MLKIKELKKMLKEMLVFCVLQLPKIVMLLPELRISLYDRLLKYNAAGFQYSVFGSGFSVLAPVLNNSNSLFWASGSLRKQLHHPV